MFGEEATTALKLYVYMYHKKTYCVHLLILFWGKENHVRGCALCDVITVALQIETSHLEKKKSVLIRLTLQMNALKFTGLVAVILNLFSIPVSASMAFGASDGLAIVFLAIVFIVIMCTVLGFLARRKGPI